MIQNNHVEGKYLDKLYENIMVSQPRQQQLITQNIEEEDLALEDFEDCQSGTPSTSQSPSCLSPNVCLLSFF